MLTHLARYYCLSILDKHHHPDIDYEKGIKILRMCTDELKRRLPIDFKGVRLHSRTLSITGYTDMRVDVGEGDRQGRHSRGGV